MNARVSHDYATAQIAAYYRALGLGGINSRDDAEAEFLHKFLLHLKSFSPDFLQKPITAIDIGCGSGLRDPKFAGIKSVKLLDAISANHANGKDELQYNGVDLYPEHAEGALQRVQQNGYKAKTVSGDGFKSNLVSMFELDQAADIIFCSHIVYGAGENFSDLISNVNQAMGKNSFAVFTHMDEDTDDALLRERLNLDFKTATNMDKSTKKFVHGGKTASDIAIEAEKFGMKVINLSFPLKLRFPLIVANEFYNELIKNPDYEAPENPYSAHNDELTFRLLTDFCIGRRLADLNESERRKAVFALKEELIAKDFQLDSPTNIQLLCRGDVDQGLWQGINNAVNEVCRTTDVKPAKLQTSYKQLKNLVINDDVQITYIASPPRTLSSPFEVALSQFADGMVYEPFLRRKVSSFDEGCQLVLNEIDAAMNRTPNRPVKIIVKDVLDSLDHTYPQKWFPLVSNFAMTVRDPHLQTHSLHTMLENDMAGQLPDAINSKVIERNNRAWGKLDETLASIKEHVRLFPNKKFALIDAHGLQMDDVSIMEKIADLFGFEFDRNRVRNWSGTKEVLPQSTWVSTTATSHQIEPIRPENSIPPALDSISPPVGHTLLHQWLPTYVKTIFDPYNVSVPSLEQLRLPVRGQEALLLEDINPITAYVFFQCNGIRSNMSESIDKDLTRIREKAPSFDKQLDVIDMIASQIKSIGKIEKAEPQVKR